MLTTMSKFLVMGVPLNDVVRQSTVNPAKAIQHPELGHLSPGAEADIAVLRVMEGRFGYADGERARDDCRRPPAPVRDDPQGRTRRVGLERPNRHGLPKNAQRLRHPRRRQDHPSSKELTRSADTLSGTIGSSYMVRPSTSPCGSGPRCPRRRGLRVW